MDEFKLRLLKKKLEAGDYISTEDAACYIAELQGPYFKGVIPYDDVIALASELQKATLVKVDGVDKSEEDMEAFKNLQDTLHTVYSYNILH